MREPWIKALLFLADSAIDIYVSESMIEISLMMIVWMYRFNYTRLLYSQNVATHDETFVLENGSFSSITNVNTRMSTNSKNLKELRLQALKKHILFRKTLYSEYSEVNGLYTV